MGEYKQKESCPVLWTGVDTFEEGDRQMIRRKHIAVFLPQIYTEYVAGFRKYIEEAVKDKEYKLYYFTCFGDNSSMGKDRAVNDQYDQGERAIFRLPDFDYVDGLIILYDTFAMSQWNEIVHMIRERCQCPVINFRTKLDLEGVTNILVDDKKAFQEIIAHFIKVHHSRKIALVTGWKGNVHSEIRLKLYREILEEYGIPYQPEMVYWGNFWKNCGDDIVEQMLAEGKERPDTIICANDYMAISVIEALKKRGIRVPEDIRVSGYDDIEESYYNDPSLTTVRQPMEQMAQTAIATLEAAWRGEPVKKVITLPEKVVLRQSCGCDSSGANHALEYHNILNEKIDKMTDLETSLTTMITFMSSTDNLQDCIDYLKEYALTDTGFRSFALCLDRGWRNQRTLPSAEYGSSRDEKVDMVVGLFHGKVLEPESFSVAQLLPKVFGQAKESVYIVPIHYLQYYMGYAVISPQYEMADNIGIRAWFLHLDNALENIRIKEKLNQVVNKLEQLYDRDTLTGLYNRRGFERYGELFYRECQMQKVSLMIMELDIDGLKIINDRYGHNEGDAAISVIAQALLHASVSEEVCIRSGGDEYVVIGRDYTQEKLEQFNIRFDAYIEQMNQTLGKAYTFGASRGAFIGIPDGVHTIENYLKIADEKMYQDKKRRKAPMR